MKRKRVMIAGLLAAIAGSCVHTGGNDVQGIYFDRPGALVAEARADKRGCQSLRKEGSTAVLAGHPELEAAADRVAEQALTRCMREKGYARIVVDGKAAKALTVMSPAERDKALQALMDANETPPISAADAARKKRSR